MATALYNESTRSFNRSAIMREAHRIAALWTLRYRNDRYRKNETYAQHLAAALGNVWYAARQERRDAIETTVQREERRTVENAALAAQINALGADTFRRAA